jgi:hypothetical protein
MAIDLSQFESAMAESIRWARLNVSMQEIADDNTALVRDMSSYDPSVTVPLLASLLTLPEYQSHCIRLEILVALSVVYCQGRKKPNIDQAVRWFFQIGKSQCVASEDPAEDIFVSLVHDRTGNYRLLEGIWEAAGFYTQRVLEVISTMPDDGRFGQIKSSFRALLCISEIVCEKAGLRRYQLGSDELYSALSRRKLPGRNALISRVMITFEELESSGIKPVDIEPFLFHPPMRDKMAAQQIGGSQLDRYPLIVFSKTHLTVALPSALSVAVRDFAIACIIECGLVDTFDTTLAKNYSNLFLNTPLLGGPIKAPVLWRKAEKHRWSTFAFEVDQGYFISFQVFLPSVETHIDGGFKTVYKEEGSLTEALQKSINDSLAKISEQPGFKEGLIVVVGCGWGKGHVTEYLEVDHPKWRVQIISAADLFRLSSLGDMSPSYIWRIQDGLEAVTRAGLHIVNPNGLLNLIGWVRSNEGHFVPHTILPEGEISSERPLMLNPPLNLLREVRAEADLGYDRHRAIDNTGIWCDVQHVSPDPFFSSDSARRLYGSMDHVRNGTLTSVFEGALQLWLSVKAPNILDSKTEYRLWEMANEWLHRLGSELDRRYTKTRKTSNLKVYVEFLDHDPRKEAYQKPTPENLIKLCHIEDHEEPKACKAIFQAGFLSGFGIAENVAERLFVRNLTRAFLHLLEANNIDEQADEITSQVVLNDDARCFHFFHAQHFMDYVRDSLPEKLVTIDQIDDAAAKIGLGWRVKEQSEGNKVEGRNACTNFLGKVVDVLLAEIFETLARFDRVSTLKRLLANSENAFVEEDHWRRTSAAIFGLYGQGDDTIRKYVEQSSKFAGAGIASRMLSEMALCVCPLEGGEGLSDIELGKLIARAALVVRIGGTSDAIHYNVLVPEIIISPLGDILFRDDFGQLVVQPMLSRVMSDKLIANAPLQKKNYDNPSLVIEEKGRINDEFLCIWKKEMGFDLDESRNIIEVLENKGVSDHAAIFEIRQSEYFSIVCSDSVRESVAASFLAQFALTTRPRWDTPPKGFARKDLYPWRFGRRLSLVARPILKVDNADDPLLIIAPNSLRKGFAYILGGAYGGRLDQSFFQSDEMRNTWWGKASEGHSFTTQVAQRLTEAGWQTRENIGIPEILNRKLDRDFGDVDVLAWRPDRRDVLVIECKDLSPARNYSEIAELLSDYQGADVDGTVDKLRRHLNRITVLEDNLKQLGRLTSVHMPQIVSCLVCSGVVPMQYAKVEALVKTHVGSIEDILAVVVPT